MQGFNVTRELASRLIGKSLRTIDRYLKRGKIRFIKVEGRTWLSREDVLSLANGHNFSNDKIDDTDMSVNTEDMKFEQGIANSEITYQNNNSIVLKNLEEKNSQLQIQLEKNTNLLNLALKKIKVLKIELSNSIDLNEHTAKINLHKENQIKYQNYIKKMDFHYKTQQKKYKAQINNINDKLDSEKLNKMIIAFILGLILVLQPLIFIFTK